MNFMPNTITGILVLACAVLPGLAGDWVYRGFIGVNWRDESWAHAIRIFTFSLLGLALYAVSTTWLPLPEPSYLLAEKLQRSDLTNMMISVPMRMGCIAAAFSD